MSTNAPLWPVWVVMCGLAAGCAYAVVMPAGLPYDEPSHWSTVQYIAANWRLPVLGDPGVTYEAQQAPLYYLMAAPISSLPNGFLMVRLFGVVGHGLVVLLTWIVIRRVLPEEGAAWLAGAGFIALNPVLIAIAGTVQNDTWALVFGVWAMTIAARGTGQANGPWSDVLLGAVMGAAILTKLSMVPVFIGVCIWLVWRRRFLATLKVVLAAALVSGWWFVRNMVLYGDLTGQSAVARTGVTFPHAELSAKYIAQSVLAYLTVPTEYVRNVIAAPNFVDGLALFTGLAIAAGLVVLVLRARRNADPPTLWMVAVVGLISTTAWLLQVLFVQPVAFRTAYGVLPLVALGVGCLSETGSRLRAAWLPAALIGSAQLLVGVWFLVAIASQPALMQP